MECKVQELEQHLDEVCVGTHQQDDAQGFNSRSPFSREIVNEQVPARFKIPLVEPYDSLAKPFDHSKGFKALMLLQGDFDALLYFAYLTTFKKVERVWFSGLQPGSIHLFDQLKRLFTTYFGKN